MSSMMLTALVLAGAATVGLVVVITQSRPTLPLVNQAAVPPVRLVATVPVIVAAAIFGITWVTVVVAFCRDQILHRVSAIEETVATTLTTMESVRTELTSLRGGLAEYGEQRETDGYLHGVRATTQRTSTGSAEVRTLHRVPPIE
jgi:hypothetical protein